MTLNAATTRRRARGTVCDIAFSIRMSCLCLLASWPLSLTGLHECAQDEQMEWKSRSQIIEFAAVNAAQLNIESKDFEGMDLSFYPSMRALCRGADRGEHLSDPQNA